MRREFWCQSFYKSVISKIKNKLEDDINTDRRWKMLWGVGSTWKWFRILSICRHCISGVDV